MSANKRQAKVSVPSTIVLKSIPGIGTLTQMVSPTSKKKNRSVDYAKSTSYMVSRKATTYHRTKLRRIIHKGQPTMTQAFKNAPETIVIKEEPYVFTQLSTESPTECPTSPSASVIDLLSHASDASSDLSEDLLPDGTLTQASGSPIVNLGPYSSNITHTQLARPKEEKLRTSMTSNTYDYGSDWNDTNP